MIVAQLFLSGMFVYEEKILKEYKIKVMEIVGWEGVWGITISSIFLGVFYLLPGEDFGSAENPIQAALQIWNNSSIMISVLISVFVIGPFNYFGTSLTKEASAMHRCLVDASRMCIVWFISMCCSWESFKGIQALGYGLILIGNLFYYELIFGSSNSQKPSLQSVPQEDIAILNESKGNHTMITKDSENTTNASFAFESEEKINDNTRKSL